MLRRAWRPLLATTTIVGTSAYAYRAYYSKGRQGREETFVLPVRKRDNLGNVYVDNQLMRLLSLSEAEQRLRQFESFKSSTRPNGITWNYATAKLASNDPIEDAHANAIVKRDPAPNAPDSDLLFFAVMDGHGGPYTSRLLSSTLIPAVALQLQELIHEPASYIPKLSAYQRLKSALSTNTPPNVPFDADPKYVSLAIQAAFAMVDSSIVNAPVQQLAKQLGVTDVTKANVPDLSSDPMALAMMLPAVSGSCALLTYIDTLRRDMYIACTGDCRAVAGVWEETEPGKGFWRVDVLTEDQTARNPNEVKRIQSEHPPDETSTVIQRGRILGNLEPARAFGDAVFKWPEQLTMNLYKAYSGDMKTRRVPLNLKTPPYVTCQPVITHRKLDFLPDLASPPSTSESQSSQSQDPKKKMRFLIIATDGLWDELSSSEVVALVGGHLAGLSGTVPCSELPKLIPTEEDPDAPTVDGKGKQRTGDREGTWAFVDDNVSTHLLRNAFGGADHSRLRRMLSIPSPLSRRHRDDTTVTVVWWEGDKTQESITLNTRERARL